MKLNVEFEAIMQYLDLDNPLEDHPLTTNSQELAMHMDAVDGMVTDHQIGDLECEEVVVHIKLKDCILELAVQY